MKIANFLVVPSETGMFVRLPLIDTDPNRGLTYGVLPVWVITDPATARIERIHAPSVSWNKYFGVNGTYRLFAYPSQKSELDLRGSVSEHVNDEAFAQYSDWDLFGKGAVGVLKAQFNRDGSKRFFGFGPGAARDDQTNYALTSLNYFAELGLPLDRDRRVRLYFNQSLRSDRTEDGAVTTLPTLASRFPGLANSRFQTTTGFGTALGYDSRDSYSLTRSGVYAKLFVTGYPRSVGNDAGFEDFGFEARGFKPIGSRVVLASQFHFEQMEGTGIPFYDLPTLGGKFSFRAYGEGRYVDRGVSYANLETRFLVWKTRMQGVPVEAWLDPFFGVGTVFPDASSIGTDTLKWTAGGAMRFVARPQVVGSIDFGTGAEGLAIFMDINYSY